LKKQGRHASSDHSATLRKQLLHGGVGSLSLKLASVLLGFILAVLLARSLGPEQYGVYGFTLTLVTLIAIPAQVGLPHLLVRETAKAEVRSDWALMRGLWRWAARYVFISSLILLTFVGSIVFLFGHHLNEHRLQALIIALPVIPLIALGNIRGAALRGLGRVFLGQLPEKVIRTAAMILFVGTLIAAGGEIGRTFSANSALTLYVASAALAFAVGAALLWANRPEGVTHETSARTKTAEWRRAVIPLALISGVQVLNSNVDMLLLGMMRTDEEVGLYRVAVQLGTLVIFGLTAINMVLHPHISRLYQSGDHQALQRLVTLSSRIILLFALPPVLVLVFLGGPVLTLLFGADYQPAHVALALLALGQLMNAGMGSVGALLNMTGHEQDTMHGMLIALTLNIVLNLALIPLLGIAGAALATALTFATWNIILWRMVRRRLGIKASAFEAWKT